MEHRECRHLKRLSDEQKHSYVIQEQGAYSPKTKDWVCAECNTHFEYKKDARFARSNQARRKEDETRR